MLVGPVSPSSSTGRRRGVDRWVPPLLRGAATVSLRLFNGRGVGFACRQAGRVLACGRTVTFELACGGRILVDRDDGLWLRSFLLDREYEPDVDHFLGRALRPSDDFIDCGANLGLWSVVASRVTGDAERVLAIEAGGAQFGQLQSNWAANGQTFHILHRAVSDRSGDTVSFFSAEGDQVSATMIVGFASHDAIEEAVETVALSDLLTERAGRRIDGGLAFVKLDIEGMEQTVLSTLDAAANADTVVLYEDHGREREDTTTKFLLDRGFIASFLAEDGRIERIDTVSIGRLRSLKVNSARGYNLVAVTPSGPAAQRIEQVYPGLDLSKHASEARVSIPNEVTEQGARPSVIVAVCTYRRNEQLADLLNGLINVVAHSAHYAIGVVIVDDTAERLAEPVVASFVGRFELGIEYRVSGQKNISLARNIGLDTGVAMGDWIAMTDDDCVPDPAWVAELLAVQGRTGALAISGPEVRCAAAGSPRWLSDQPFLEAGLNDFPDGAAMSIASTHNSMLSTHWLRDHPLRFEPDLGRLGGEDMVFFKTASSMGLTINYARNAKVYEVQPPERCRYRYLLRNAIWLGNSQFITNVRGQTASHPRMAAHGLRELQRAITRPLARVVRGQAPQLRFALASALRATGILAGAIGIRINHH